MAKKTQAGTNVQHVKQKNQQAAQKGAQGQYGTEFASETMAGTNVQEVKKQNQKAEQNKK